MDLSAVHALKMAISDLLLNLGLGLFLAFPIGYSAFVSKKNTLLNCARKFSSVAVMLSVMGVQGFGTMPLQNFLYKLYLVAIGGALVGFVCGALVCAAFRAFSKERISPGQSGNLEPLVTSKRNLYAWAIVITILLMFAYFIVSPYQNCMRTVNHSTWCIANTSW